MKRVPLLFDLSELFTIMSIILMKQDLRLIPRFRMLGKPLGKSLNFPQCAMVGSMCEGL